MHSIVRWLLALPLFAAASGVLADCPVDRPIQVAFYELGVNFDPHTQSGRDLDIINELARRSGCRFEHRFDSRVRIWKQLEDGTLDMTVSALDTPEREKFVRFVLISWDRDIILVHLKPGFPVTADGFLNDRTLVAGAVKGYRYTPGIDQWVDTLRAQHRTYEAPDLATLFKVFDAGRVAAIPIEPEALPAIGKRYQLSQPFQRVDWFAHSPKSGGGLALSRARLPEELGIRLHDEIEQMRQDGTLQRIYENYTNHNLALEMLSPE